MERPQQYKIDDDGRLLYDPAYRSHLENYYNQLYWMEEQIKLFTNNS